MSEDKMLKEIAAVLALAEGTNHPGERETAMKRYQTLVTRHGIDLQTVRDFTEGKQAPEKAIMEKAEVGTKGDRGGGAYTNLLVAIAGQNNLECITYNDNRWVDLYGFPSDIKAAKDLYAVVVGQMVQECMEYLERGEYSTSRAEARRSFYIGFTNEIEKRLQEARIAAEDEARDEYAERGISTDIVLRDKRKQVRELYYEDWRKIWKNPPRKRHTARDRNARGAGTHSGRNARIFKTEAVGARGRISN